MEEILKKCRRTPNLNNRLILCPLNRDVDRYNRRILDLLPGEEQTYLSADSPAEVDPLAVNVVDHDVSELNAFDPAQMPPHRLELRVGAIVMLLRNVNVQLGMCNGTRMIITELHSNVIRCRIINESSRMFNQVVNLPRFKFEFDGSRQGELTKGTSFVLSFRFAWPLP
uniref:ATP-dependent DNA helicase n=1 Tax=Ditylenchus dipsaci TaxID=166011 RepID=A0A915EJ78_9BILA